MSANEDVIRIMCPNLTCKRILAVPASARGKLVRCRGCGINLRIPIGKSLPDTSGNVAGTAKPAAPNAAPSTGKAA